MSTIRVVIGLLDILLEQARAGERAVLATLVRSRGSTPQKAGATMVVTADGRAFGTLGGGCTEAEARARALELLSSGEQVRKLLTFRLNHDYGWDDGLICGGIMDVSLEVFEGGNTGELEAMRGELLARRAVRRRVEVEGQAFELEVAPEPSLLIAGAGHVARALAGIAAAAGFGVTVVDDRADLASAERFPGARIVVGAIDVELSRLAIDGHTYVVIVTRGHRNDGQSLGAVARSAARYVGLIGSKRKIRTIMADLEAQGVPRDLLMRVHAPIGLNIGAVTPEEIAVSICAELIAARRGVEETGAMKMSGEELGKWLDRGELG